MDRLLPFRATHFNPRHVDDLGAVIAPPYDVVSSEEGQRLAARHPYNAVRLELTIPPEADVSPGLATGDPLARYRQAAELWKSWQAEGILIKDEKPALYLCEHEFFYPSTGDPDVAPSGRFTGGHPQRRASQRVRTAVLGALALDPASQDQPGEGAVLAHERTMPRPKEDRLQLLRSCHAQFSPILVLYHDPPGRVASVLQEARESADPELEARLPEGEALRVWRIADERTVRNANQLLATEPLVIADGHHRYESARRFAAETGKPEHRRILAALISTSDPGLVMLPTHRLVTAPPDLTRQLLEGIRTAFGEDQLLPPSLTLERLAPAISGTAIGILTGEGTWLLQPRGETVEALQLLDNILATWEGSATTGVSIEFTRDAHRAREAVRAGRHQMAILLPPVSPAEVWQNAREGRLFPRKTTYFYPKAPAGLLMCDLDDRASL